VQLGDRHLGGRRWTVDAGSVTLRPVTRRLAHDVLDGGPITRTFEEGSLHDRIPQAMDITIRDIDSGAAAVLPTVWLIVRQADGRILSDLGNHGPPDREGCVEIGYSLAPSARGQGIGTAAVAAFVRRLAEAPGIRRLTAVTGAQNTASRRLLERQGFYLTGPLRAQIRCATQGISARRSGNSQNRQFCALRPWPVRWAYGA
jgi:RimJ/RimL family protein N-acetyltransferase